MPNPNPSAIPRAPARTRSLVRCLVIVARATLGLVCLAVIHPLAAAAIDPASGRVHHRGPQ